MDAPCTIAPVHLMVDLLDVLTKLLVLHTASAPRTLQPCVKPTAADPEHLAHHLDRELMAMLHDERILYLQPTRKFSARASCCSGTYFFRG